MSHGTCERICRIRFYSSTRGDFFGFLQHRSGYGQEFKTQRGQSFPGASCHDNRLVQHRRSWMQERSIGTQILLPNANLQGILEANILTLLQLHDKNFVSPGPHLYHHFWFRDAAPILHALDRFGYHKRVRQSIHTFAEKMTGDGFFRGRTGNGTRTAKRYGSSKSIFSFPHRCSG